MTPAGTMSKLRFVAASAADVRRGLLGWVSFVLADVLVVESVAVRESRAGALTLSYPRRADRHGNARDDVRPRDDAACRTLDALVFAALGFRSEAGVT